jgi:ABC-type transport system substrate-binding protein
VQANLSQIGIKATIDAREGAQFSAAYRDGSYELFVNAQGFRADPVFKLNQYGAPDQPPQSFWYDWPNGWKNDQMMEMYQKAVSTFDVEERAAIIKDLQRMGLEESTFIYLVVPERIDIVRSRVKNWFIDFMDFNHALRTVWVEEA